MQRLSLPVPAPATVLAVGAFLKNRACLLQGSEVLWSAPHGDLSDPAACVALHDALAALVTAARRPIDAIAHDLHPDFPSTRSALEWAQRLRVPTRAVQHHHAHLGVVMAEQGWSQGPVGGWLLDGVGLGLDGTAWGGELLAGTPQGFERLAHLAPVALPGGDAAAREPWRVAAAVLHRLGRGEQIAPRFGPQVGHSKAQGVALLLQRGLHCPVSSSAGRWFDAAAAALGLAPTQQAEAEAAIALERAATAWLAEVGTTGLPAPGAPTLDLHGLVGRLFDEPQSGRGAALFHATLAAALVDAAQHQGLKRLVLAGGCFHNRLLSRLVEQGCSERGIATWRPQAVDCGDAGLALGQAWLVAHAMAHDPAHDTAHDTVHALADEL